MKYYLKKVFCWAPRILALTFVVFLSLFAFDVFEGPFKVMMIVGFLIHLLPSFVLLALTIVAWRFPVAGSIAFIGFALLYILLAGFDKPWSWYALVSGPAIIIGILYFIDWLDSRTKRTIMHSTRQM